MVSAKADESNTDMIADKLPFLKQVPIDFIAVRRYHN